MTLDLAQETKSVKDLVIGDRIRVGNTLTHVERVKPDSRNSEVELTLGRTYKNQAPMILILKKWDHITTGW